MAQGARNGCEIAEIASSDELEERDLPEDFGRGKPEAKRLNSDGV